MPGPSGGWTLLFAAALGAGAAAAAPPDHGTGESIYLSGVTSTGPVRAFVAGDVAIEGASASCRSCHQRSGFGSFEGTSAAPPVAGRILFAPRAGGVAPRPAYDRAGLARALRDGVDPAGRPLDPLMPRFSLAESDVDSLAGYLTGLSASPSPGVDATTLNVATVVTSDADPDVRQATLEVLRAYFQSKNARTRGEGRPGKRDRAFREWKLLVWTLGGPASGWPEQLERLYRETPVFALVSGAGGARWDAVHEFCERKGLPSILPNIDVLPKNAGEGYYNVYFSPGLGAEAFAVAAAIAPAPGAKVVQALADPVPSRAAEILRSAVTSRGLQPPIDVDRNDPARLLREANGSTDIVLWLRGVELERALRVLAGSRSTARLYLSSTLLGDESPSIPAGWETRTVFARPYAPVPEAQARFRRTSAWLRSQGIAVSNARVQDQTLAACGVLGEALMHAGTEFVRDYVLEWVDHGGGMQTASSFYRTLAFGPSQRILSRSCALVEAAPLPAPSLLPAVSR